MVDHKFQRRCETTRKAVNHQHIALETARTLHDSKTALLDCFLGTRLLLSQNATEVAVVVVVVPRLSKRKRPKGKPF